MTTPFWPVTTIGIVSFVEHRFFAPLDGTAASAEWGPFGSTVSNVVTGAAGSELNVEGATPPGMKVSPSSTSRIPSPCSTNSTSGKAALACETRYAGPVSGFLRTGVRAVADPITEPSGQVAGFLANTWSGQACWIVVSLEGISPGITSLVLPMFACPGDDLTLTVRLAPFCLLKSLSVEISNTGLKGRLPRLFTWNGLCAGRRP